MDINVNTALPEKMDVHWLVYLSLYSKCSDPHSWNRIQFILREWNEYALLNAKWSIISCWKNNLFCDDDDNDNSGLLTLPEHLSWPLVFSGVRVTRSLVLYVCFVDIWMSFCSCSFGHYVVYSSSIYRFWLPLWYLLTLLSHILVIFSDFE